MSVLRLFFVLLLVQVACISPGQSLLRGDANKRELVEDVSTSMPALPPDNGGGVVIGDVTVQIIPGSGPTPPPPPSPTVSPPSPTAPTPSAPVPIGPVTVVVTTPVTPLPPAPTTPAPPTLGLPPTSPTPPTTPVPPPSPVVVEIIPGPGPKPPPASPTAPTPSAPVPIGPVTVVVTTPVTPLPPVPTAPAPPTLGLPPTSPTPPTTPVPPPSPVVVEIIPGPGPTPPPPSPTASPTPVPASPTAGPVGAVEREPETAATTTVPPPKIPETCQYNEKWDWAGDPANLHPIIPCTEHSTCANFTNPQDRHGFPGCCIVKDCLCGSSQIEFVPGVLHCARFACTSDEECAPGMCVNGACNFDNIEPECRDAEEDCGSAETSVCVNGICRFRNPVTGSIDFFHG